MNISQVKMYLDGGIILIVLSFLFLQEILEIIA